jgi:hypothetical protein
MANDMPRGCYRHKPNIGHTGKHHSKESKEKIGRANAITMSGRKNEKANAWKGDKVGYQAIHNWLVKNFGKADRCENKYCKTEKPKRYEWALKKGAEYQRRRSSFLRLCTVCHHRYDDITNKGWIKRKINVA